MAPSRFLALALALRLHDTTEGIELTTALTKTMVAGERRDEPKVDTRSLMSRLDDTNIEDLGKTTSCGDASAALLSILTGKKLIGPISNESQDFLYCYDKAPSDKTQWFDAASAEENPLWKIIKKQADHSDPSPRIVEVVVFPDHTFVLEMHGGGVVSLYQAWVGHYTMKDWIKQDHVALTVNETTKAAMDKYGGKNRFDVTALQTPLWEIAGAFSRFRGDNNYINDVAEDILQHLQPTAIKVFGAPPVSTEMINRYDNFMLMAARAEPAYRDITKAKPVLVVEVKVYCGTEL